MLLKTYEFIKANLHLVDIDLENGTINNQKEYKAREYRRVSFAGKSMEIHKIIGVAAFGKEVVNKVINHINGNKFDNRIANLEVVTHRRNIQHAVELGLIKRKLTADTVKEIKKLIHEGAVNSEIAKLHNVTDATIWSIKNGHTWGHVKINLKYDHSKPLRKINLSPEDVDKIHDLYAIGYTQAQIAPMFECSQATIGRVINGTHRFKKEGEFIVRKKFTTTLDDKLIKALKLKAVNENTDVSKIIEKTLKEMLENEKN